MSKAQQELINLIFDRDDVSWQSMLYELVRTEKMNPWDIDIAVLTNRFFELIKTLKEMDFRISGKVLLAAAILLKLKSVYLIKKDIEEFDNLFAEPEEEALFDEDYDTISAERERYKGLPLPPRLPQLRKRKVSIYELIDALQKAMEVKRRRILRELPPPAEIHVPKKSFNVTEAIKTLYEKIVSFFRAGRKITFSVLCPSKEKEDKVYTFIPLLHLANQRKIDIEQKEHFGEIEIYLKTAKALGEKALKEQTF